ncbi:MAG: PQQ-dependent sugar dehydrogenase [Gemmatimonadaceae bacterium]|nr:PQQ-dependent sugar dehydrogenase [Gemmatimonadaceae bacterium]MCW5826162.1 PQQ-dependent sugar dehydrogenase [Gemmatimonadaceae bacterium]
MSFRPFVLAAALAAPVLAGAQTEPQRSVHHTYRLVTVVEGLVNPWSIAFLPGGDMLVTERPGRLRIVRGGRLLAEPVSGLPAIRVGNQGGLLDVVPHPDFARNRLVYISYAKPNAEGNQSTTAIIRARFENDRLTNVTEIFEAQAWSAGQGHYGSRLAFDKAGFLFITVGDRQVPPTGDLEAHPAQSLRTHHGKVIRLHDDGRVPADNPFVGRDDALPQIWSYGHRNQQALLVHPVSGDVWATEHGPQGGDELNLIQPGKNYGWPVIGFGVNYRTGSAIHSGTVRQGMEQPVRVWVPSIATSGMMAYTGNAFPNWQGHLFAGGLAGEVLVRLRLDGTRVMEEELLVQRRGRIRDVRQGPDGFIYLAMEDRMGAPSAILRLEPAR